MSIINQSNQSKQNKESNQSNQNKENNTSIDHLFKNNKVWVEQVLAQDADFFKRLETQQKPEFLWIGCSDSRVPANQITGLMPGEVFVHRNIANMVIHTDLNMLSVVQFAVDVLQVKQIIVCGHYGCSGVLAGLEPKRLGIVDLWLKHVKDVAYKHSAYLGSVTHSKQHKLLCELNVIEQAKNLALTPVIQDAWDRRQSVQIHGLIYGVMDGVLRDLSCHLTSNTEVEAQYQQALNCIEQKINP